MTWHFKLPKMPSPIGRRSLDLALANILCVAVGRFDRANGQAEWRRLENRVEYGLLAKNKDRLVQCRMCLCL